MRMQIFCDFIEQFLVVLCWAFVLLNSIVFMLNLSSKYRLSQEKVLLLNFALLKSISTIETHTPPQSSAVSDLYAVLTLKTFEIKEIKVKIYQIIDLIQVLWYRRLNILFPRGLYNSPFKADFPTLK